MLHFQHMDTSCILFPRHLIFQNGQLIQKQARQQSQRFNFKDKHLSQTCTPKTINYVHSIRFLYDSKYYDQLRQYQKRTYQCQIKIIELYNKFEAQKKRLNQRILHQQEQLINREAQIQYLSNLLNKKESQYQRNIGKSLQTAFPVLIKRSQEILGDIQQIVQPKIDELIEQKFNKIRFSQVDTNCTKKSRIFQGNTDSLKKIALIDRIHKSNSLLCNMLPSFAIKQGNRRHTDHQPNFFQRNHKIGYNNYFKASICSEFKK